MAVKYPGPFPLSGRGKGKGAMGIKESGRGKGKLPFVSVKPLSGRGKGKLGGFDLSKSGKGAKLGLKCKDLGCQ